MGRLTDKIRKKLERKGFLDLIPNQLLELNKKCFQALYCSSKGDPDGERDSLYEMRGGCPPVEKEFQNCDREWRVWPSFIGDNQQEFWQVGKWNYEFPAASEVYCTCLYQNDALKVAEVLNRLSKLETALKQV
ncbi:hypothetical protein MTAT_19860 [Moorella thermoacetica]|uniref:Uncharacterized protein n=1 Tax=Neomoorella thermoacetica TaxID=1525 RepID=A0AAC9HIZ9_NEOTH|nr:hypothetical protein [Moorella thermoacetica]AOQ24641.1 hypothetical protein Maut_02213 [Moorella thermoacetica]TYL12744.1 hypothetical protein MTAT_19860 [Moorella thermoacetica]